MNPNSLVVTGTARTSTWFAKIFGIDHFTVSASAIACSPCSASPVDVVIAIDRTGSMCLDQYSRHDCDDLDNAKKGVRKMLGILNPPYAQIGMVAFPPLKAGTSNLCSSPQGLSDNYTAYDDPNAIYLNDRIGSDYKASGVINEASGLAKHTVVGDGNCIKADGYTSYSEALRQAKNELDAHGRINVPDVIVFLTDGEANIGSVYGVDSPTFPPGNADDQRPCQTAIDLANSYKSQGVTIYSIGYALGNNTKCTASKYGPWIPKQAAIKEDGKTTFRRRSPRTGAISDSTAIGVELRRRRLDTERTQCDHEADDHNESPVRYSDDTRSEDIA